MSTNYLGRVYAAGECVVRQGEIGTCMYVVQRGELEVVSTKNGHDVRLRVLKTGDIFGEMSMFYQFKKDRRDSAKRTSTVRALTEVQVLTVDKRTLLNRIKEDPLTAVTLIEMLCERIGTLTEQVHQVNTYSARPHLSDFDSACSPCE